MSERELRGVGHARCMSSFRLRPQVHIVKGDPVSRIGRWLRHSAQPAVQALRGMTSVADRTTGDCRTCHIATGQQIVAEPPVPIGRRPMAVEADALQHGPFNLLADGGNDRVGRHVELRVRDGTWPPPAVGSRIAKRHPLCRHRRREPVAPLNRHGGHEEVDGDSFTFGVVDLRRHRGHLGPGAPVEDRHLGAGASRYASRIDGRVASADHHHPIADLHGLSTIDSPQVVDAAEDAGSLLARKAQHAARLCTDPEIEGMMAITEFIDRHLGAHRHTGNDLDPEIHDALDLGVEHARREPIVGNAEPEHAPGIPAALVHRHRIATACHLIGEGQPGRPGTDDADRLLPRLEVDRFELQVLVDPPVTDEALEGVDGNRLIFRRAVTSGLARVRADTSKHSGERVDVGEDPPGLVECGIGGEAVAVPLRHDPDPAPHVPATGTVQLAGRGLLDLGRAV